MDLRLLFKFEFFYFRKVLFFDEIEVNLEILYFNWIILIEVLKVKKLVLFKDFEVIVVLVVLYFYIEVY